MNFENQHLEKNIVSGKPTQLTGRGAHNNELIAILKIKDSQTKLSKMIEWAKETNCDDVAVATLLELEPATSYVKMNDIWLFMKEGFSKSEYFSLSYGSFLLRNNKYDKVLKLLANMKTTLKVFRFELVCEASYKLGQYQIIIKQYNHLSKSLLKKLSKKVTMIVAQVMLKEGQYEIAENIFEQLKNDHSSKNLLPSLEKLMIEKKKNNDFKSWFEKLKSQAQEKESRKKVKLFDWVKYSTVLIAENKFKEALVLLTKLRSEV